MVGGDSVQVEFPWGGRRDAFPLTNRCSTRQHFSKRNSPPSSCFAHGQETLRQQLSSDLCPFLVFAWLLPLLFTSLFKQTTATSLRALSLTARQSADNLKPEIPSGPDDIDRDTARLSQGGSQSQSLDDTCHRISTSTLAMFTLVGVVYSLSSRKCEYIYLQNHTQMPLILCVRSLNRKSAGQSGLEFLAERIFFGKCELGFRRSSSDLCPWQTDRQAGLDCSDREPC